MPKKINFRECSSFFYSESLGYFILKSRCILFTDFFPTTNKTLTWCMSGMYAF